MRILNEDPKKLALASPISVSDSNSNTSTGMIAVGTVSSTSVANFSDDFEVIILEVDPTTPSAGDFKYEIYHPTTAATSGQLIGNYG